MNLGTVIEITGGGPGSGCNPKVGKCGRSSGWRPSEAAQIKADAYRVIYEQYGQLSHTQINEWLREGRPTPKYPAQQDAEYFVGKIEKAFNTPGAHEVLRQPMRVYRGIDSLKVYNKFNRGNWKGKTFTDKGIMSTSKSYDIAEKAVDLDEKGVVLQIEMPKGTSYLHGRADEKELIFAPGMRLKVDRVEKGVMWDGLIEVRAHPVSE